MRRGDAANAGGFGADDRAVRDDLLDPRGLRAPVSGDGRWALRPSSEGSDVGLCARTVLDEAPGALPRRGQRAPRARLADGGAERAPGGRSHTTGLRFDRAIPPGGYQWHYLDGVSEDGPSAIVVIALVVNPFSPRYARPFSASTASAYAFCARAPSRGSATRSSPASTRSAHLSEGASAAWSRWVRLLTGFRMRHPES